MLVLSYQLYPPVFSQVLQPSYSGTSAFNAKAVANYTVNGVAGGTFKSVSNLSWLRVFGAGHEVPYYRKYTYLSITPKNAADPRSEPALALQVFEQTMKKQAISST